MAKPITKRTSLVLPFILTFASSACSKSPVSKAEEKHGEDPVKHRNPPPTPDLAPAKAPVAIDAGTVSKEDETSMNSDAPSDAGVSSDAALVPTSPPLEINRVPRQNPPNRNPPRVLRKPQIPKRPKRPIRKNPPSPRSDSSPIAKPKTDE